MSVWQLKYACNASYSAHAPLNRDNGGLLPDTYLHIVNKNKRSYISDCWLSGTFSFPSISGGQCRPLLLQLIYYWKMPWLKKIIWVIRVLRRRRPVVVNLFPYITNDYSAENRNTLFVIHFATHLSPHFSAHVFTANHITRLPTATLSINQSNRSPGILNFQLSFSGLQSPRWSFPIEACYSWVQTIFLY